MLFATPLAGLALTLTNPSTNRLIAVRVAPRLQGWFTGLKQSGGQLSSALAGIVLPSLAIFWDWRRALVSLVLLGPAVLLLVRLSVPDDGVVSTGMTEATGEHLGPTGAGFVRVATAYGFFMSAGTGMFIFSLPLFAFDQHGLSGVEAGLVASVAGISAPIGRLSWGPLSARFSNASTGLTVLVGGSAMGVVMLWASSIVGPGLLWPAVIVLGVFALAWNTPLMLGLIRVVGRAGSGVAAGKVMSGIYAGAVASPILAGWLIDATASYGPVDDVLGADGWWRLDRLDVATPLRTKQAVTVVPRDRGGIDKTEMPSQSPEL